MWSEPGGARVHRFSIPTGLDQLATLRDWVEHVIRMHFGSEISVDEMFYIELAVQEATTNVILHSQHTEADQGIDVAVGFAGRAVEIELLYNGVDFDSSPVPLPHFDGSREGGFGLFIIKQVMDDVEYGRGVDRRNFIRLRKQVNAKGLGTHDCH